MHVGTFTPRGHLGGRGRASCRSSPTLGVTRARGDAGRRLPRPLRLGLRRRRPLRPDPALRPARRLPRASSTAPTPPGLGVILDVVYNHLGPDGNYLAAVRRRLLHETAQDRLGRGAQLRRRGQRPGARVLRRQRRATGSTSSTSTACASTPRRTIFDDSPRAHPRGDRAGGAREAAGGAAIVLVAENEPQQTQPRPPARAGRLRPRRALERRLPPHRDGRADRPQRGVLHRLPRHAAGVHLGRRSTASCTRGSATPGRRSAAARRRSTCRRRRS